jgi:uncharacterized ferritin-like protein (DUF455 family)
VTRGRHARCRAALLAGDPEEKARLARALAADWRAGRLDRDDQDPAEPIPQPGLPPRLQLVPPRKLARRGTHTPEGRANLFHAVAHIEFSAINLALDAVYRFRGLPDAYYHDWLQVAEEEVGHFELIRAHLRTLGCDYGDLPAHDSLWAAACATADDPLARMALVPRYLEARGLDVNPGMQDRLREAGDLEGVAILEVILRDEIGHVARGDHWFRYLCAQRGLDPETSYRELVQRHIRSPWHGPFHCAARRQAGFSEGELRALGCAGGDS